MRIEVHGRAAHGSTPWLGDNAILKAIDVFRAIESLPFTRESSELFDRPSINLGRIDGGDAVNKVPDRCTMVVDIRYLPGQDPGEILEEIAGDRGHRGDADVHPPAGHGLAHRSLRAGTARCGRSIAPESETLSVGRDGASDAASFIEAGIPAVEFGPTGGGHHGPEEWVSLTSLARYRHALRDFVRSLPIWLERRPSRTAGAGRYEGGLSR